MNNEDKRLISEYMGWFAHPQGFWYDPPVYFAAGVHGNIDFDLNDAGLCVKEMQKREDWRNFLIIARNLHRLEFDSQVIAWLYNADNFFTVMAKWLKEEEK